MVSTEQDPARPGTVKAVIRLLLAITLLASFALLSSFTITPALTAEEGCTWYFAEGSTRGGFEQWLTLFNPGPDDLKVTVTYVVAEGANRERIYALASHTRLNVYVNQEIGSGHDLGMEIYSSGFFLAERSLYFYYDGRWSGGHISRGTREPSDRWYFAEGSTRENYETWISLLNPNEEECSVELTFLCAGGEGIVHSARIPADGRYTVSANQVVGSNRDFFIQVGSSLPVVAERPVYFLYLDAWPGGHNVMGAPALSADWYFAQGCVQPGYDTWLCLANPGPDDAKVTVSLYGAAGPAASTILALPGYSRVTADLANLAEAPGDYAIRVSSSVPIVAERPIYFCTADGLAGGSCAAGSPVTARHWYLAEGSTRSGFETQLWLGNYGDEPASATLTFFFSDGSTRPVEKTVPAASLICLDLREVLGGEDDVSCEVVSDRDIVVERSTFFLYHDLWAGGDAVTAYPAP
jgi:hypothetical protein